MSDRRVIRKYPLLFLSSLEMPAGASILSADAQNGVPTIWVLVDPEMPLVTRRMLVLGTGHEIALDAREHLDRFVGTVQSDDGSLVWHVFDGGEEHVGASS